MSMSLQLGRPPTVIPLIWQGLVWGCTLVLLNACGWQPRGAFVTTDQLGKIYISGMSNDPIGRSLKKDISAAGGEMTPFSTNADHIVWIGNQETENRDASYDALIRTVEKEIVIRVVFEVRSASGKRIYGPEMIYAERVYEYDVQGVTSTAAQVEVIENELKENIGRQIALRLSSLQPVAEEDDTDTTNNDQATLRGPDADEPSR